MTGAEVANHFNAKKTGRGRWMALCSAHADTNRSLSISEGKRGVLLTCWSQRCDVRDIVKAAGLTMNSLFYDSGRRIDFRVERERQRKALQNQADEYRGRIRNWMVLFANKPYTRRQYEDDVGVACAMAIRLTGGEDKPHLHALMRTAMERITAAQILKSRTR